MRMILRVLAALVFTLLAAPPALAHKPSDSYLTLTAQGDLVSVRWDVALRDLDAELGLDVNDDGVLSWGEVRSRSTDIIAFVTPQLAIRGKISHAYRWTNLLPRAQLPPRQPHIKPAPETCRRQTHPVVNLALATHSDGTYAVLQYQLRCARGAAVLVVDYHLFAASDPTHRGIVRVIGLDSRSPLSNAGSLAVLGPGNPHHEFALTGTSRLTALWSFITEGIWHIWLGFDHVLFLLTLLLPSVMLASKARLGGRGSARYAARRVENCHGVYGRALPHADHGSAGLGKSALPTGGVRHCPHRAAGGS